MVNLATPLIALCTLAYVNGAVGSTAFSSEIGLVSTSSVAVGSMTPSSGVSLAPVPSVTGPEPQVPVAYSTEVLTTTVPAPPQGEMTTTTSTTTTVTVAITSTVFSAKSSSTVEGVQNSSDNGEGHITVQTSTNKSRSHMTVQTSISSELLSIGIQPTQGNSSAQLSSTISPSRGASTILVTHTANRSMPASTGGPKPTMSASAPPDLINGATSIEFGIALMALAISVAVFRI